MIRLNNRDYAWREGMTISTLLDENDLVYKRIIVSINGRHVPEQDWDRTQIKDGDEVSALHLMAGG
jgi:thiamine biosynthesis protein ThiS